MRLPVIIKNDGWEYIIEVEVMCQMQAVMLGGSRALGGSKVADDASKFVLFMTQVSVAGYDVVSNNGAYLCACIRRCVLHPQK